MFMNKLQLSPARTTSVAMSLLVVGLAILVCGIVWPPALNAQLGHEWGDFLHGFLFGLAITLEFGALILVTSAAKSRKES